MRSKHRLLIVDVKTKQKGGKHRFWSQFTRTNILNKKGVSQTKNTTLKTSKRRTECLQKVDKL